VLFAHAPDRVGVAVGAVARLAPIERAIRPEVGWLFMWSLTERGRFTTASWTISRSWPLMRVILPEKSGTLWNEPQLWEHQRIGLSGVLADRKRSDEDARAVFVLHERVGDLRRPRCHRQHGESEDSAVVAGGVEGAVAGKGSSRRR